MRPSFIAGGINGFLLLLVIIMTGKYWDKLDIYQKIIAVSLVSIQFALHAGIHHVEEIQYGFNPLEGQLGDLTCPKQKRTKLRNHFYCL